MNDGKLQLHSPEVDRCDFTVCPACLIHLCCAGGTLGCICIGCLAVDQGTTWCGTRVLCMLACTAAMWPQRTLWQQLTIYRMGTRLVKGWFFDRNETIGGGVISLCFEERLIGVWRLVRRHNKCDHWLWPRLPQLPGQLSGCLTATDDLWDGGRLVEGCFVDINVINGCELISLISASRTG